MRITSASLLGLVTGCWASRVVTSGLTEACTFAATRTVFVTVYPLCPTSAIPTTTIFVSPVERSSRVPHTKTVSQFTTITIPDLFSGISSSDSISLAIPTGQSVRPSYNTEQASFTDRATSTTTVTSSDGSMETFVTTDASGSIILTRLSTRTVTRTVSLAPPPHDTNVSGQTSGVASATIQSSGGAQTICSSFTIIGPDGQRTITSATIVLQPTDTASAASKTQAAPTQSSNSVSGTWVTRISQLSTASFSNSEVQSSSDTGAPPYGSISVYGDATSQAQPTPVVSRTASNTPWMTISYGSVDPTSLSSLQPYVVLSQQPSEWASSILSGKIPDTLATPPSYTPCNTTSLLTSTWINIIPEPTTTYTLEFPMTTLVTITIPPLVPFGRKARRRISENLTLRENTAATDFTTRTLAGNSAIQASLSSLLGHAGTSSELETPASPTQTPQVPSSPSTLTLPVNSSTQLSWSIPLPPTTPSSIQVPSNLTPLSIIPSTTMASWNDSTTSNVSPNSSNFSTPMLSSALSAPTSLTPVETPTMPPTSSPVIGTLLSTLFSTLPTPSSSTTPGDVSTAAPTPSLPLPTQCPFGGRVGNFTLDFDKLEGGPLLNPAEDLWFSEGFLVAPPSSPPFNAYVPSSGGNLVEFVPSGLSPVLSPSSSGDVAEIGVGPNFANPCFKLDFFGASLGCAAEGVERWCEFEVSAFTHNIGSSTETSMAWSETKRIPACPTFPSGTCKLTPVEFDGYTNITAIMIRLRVGLELRVWWGDDFKFGWSDNSCEASRCRSDAGNRKVKRELVEHTVARGVWQWTPYGLKKLDDAYIYASAL